MPSGPRTGSQEVLKGGRRGPVSRGQEGTTASVCPVAAVGRALVVVARIVATPAGGSRGRTGHVSRPTPVSRGEDKTIGPRVGTCAAATLVSFPGQGQEGLTPSAGVSRTSNATSRV